MLDQALLDTSNFPSHEPTQGKNTPAQASNLVAANPDLRRFLAETPPYNTWSADSRALIADSARWLSFKKGEAIPMVSRPGQHLHLLTEGVFGLVVTMSNGSDMVTGYVHPGIMLGLTSLFDADAPAEYQEWVAHSPAMAWQIPSNIFKDCMASDTAMATSYLQVFASFYRRLIDDLACRTLLPARAQVARCLLDAEAPRDRSRLWTNASPSWPSLTQAQIGRMLGLSRQSVGTILRELEAQGLIRIGRQKISLLSVDGLRAIVAGPGKSGAT